VAISESVPRVYTSQHGCGPTNLGIRLRPPTPSPSSPANSAGALSIAPRPGYSSPFSACLFEDLRSPKTRYRLAAAVVRQPRQPRGGQSHDGLRWTRPGPTPYQPRRLQLHCTGWREVGGHIREETYDSRARRRTLRASAIRACSSSLIRIWTSSFLRSLSFGVVGFDPDFWGERPVAAGMKGIY